MPNKTEAAPGAGSTPLPPAVDAEARYRELVESLPDGLCVLDGQGACTEVNGAWLAMCGYGRDELIGAKVADLLHPDDLPRSAAYFARLKREGGYKGLRARARRKDGSYLWIEVSSTGLFEDGVLVGSRDTIRDVTAQVDAETALQASEADFRELVENVSDVVYTLGPDGAILYVSPPIDRILGYTHQELTGRRMFEFLHPEDAAQVRQRVAAMTQSAPGPSVQRVIARDGSVRWVRTLSRPVFKDGQLIAMRGFMSDVTEVRHLEEQLLQAQKMEAIGQLAGGVAHDFNNLLTVVLGHASLMLDLAADDDTRADLQVIMDAALRGAGLTGQLLTFSRRQVWQPQSVSPDVILADMVTMLRRLIGEHIELLTDLAAPDACVMVDPGQFEQVVMNLVVNARDAMADGGRLELRTRVADAAATDHLLPDGRAGSVLLLQVRDSGSGIEPAVLDHIFEPFFTTKSSGKGTGLGLSTAYGIVARASGSVLARSQLGQGSTMEVALPLTDIECHETAAEQEAKPDVSGAVTVLLAEDEAPLRRLATRVLKRNGYRVLAAANGEEALHLYEVHAGEIDILVTDIVMPRLGGVALAGEIRRRASGLPVLFMSGHTEGELLAQVPDAAAGSFLAKPFRPVDLGEQVRRLLNA